MNYQVNVLRLGRFQVPNWEVFWMSKFNTAENSAPLPLTLNMVVIRGGGKTAIINTGPSREKIPVLDETWRRLFGPDASLHVDESEYPENALATLGIKPDDVDYVFVTPFQTYSVGNINMFKNAQICLSRKGWINLWAPKWKQHPHDQRAGCIPDENLHYLVFEAWDRIRLLEDEDTVLDGLSVFWSGVHHRASICVKAETASGPVIASDSFFYLENVEQMWPIGINESMEEALTAYDRVRREAAHIIPLYDPKVYDRYPDGIVVK
jgi:glyoxylase-like metal-dependent hydrolase (beta-lactamase superfamily II)